MKLTRVSLMNRAPIWLLLFLRCRAYGKACDDVFKQLNLSDSRTRYDVETSIALQMLARSVRLLRAGTHASGKAEECPEKLDPRSYCEDCPVSHITVLWSYPGSGNTYTRTLIEGSTLILTGSVYIDESIALEMPGENVDVNSAKTCAKLSVIKMHPFIQDSGWASDCGISFLSICGLQAKRAIFLVRHPISAGWAEFQRRLTSSHTGNPIEAVGDMNIKKAEWFQSWKSAARTMLYEWAGMWDEDAYFGRYMETYGDGAFTILRFEDLMHPSIREVSHF